MLAIAIALTAFLVYVAISLAVGDFFPFSRYSMYARLTSRTEGAVLYLRAGERFVAPDDLDAVCGLDVSKLGPEGIPTSQEWVTHEAKRWLQLRAVDAIPDGVPLEVGYRMMRVDDDGRLHERLQPMTSGRARLRP